MTNIDDKIDQIFNPYKHRENPYKNCFDAAMSYDFTAFALQDGGQCFGSDNKESYKKYGNSDKCGFGENGETWEEWKGGAMANYVWEIERGKLSNFMDV